MKTLHAGATLDCLSAEFLQDCGPSDIINKFIASCSFFDLEIVNEIEGKSLPDSPIFKVLANLLQRGKPTRLNQFALMELINRSPYLETVDDDAEIKVEWTNLFNDADKIVFRSLHFTEPRMTGQDIARYSKRMDFGSDFERNFFLTGFNEVFGVEAPAIQQLLVLQRNLDSLLKHHIPKEIPEHLRVRFAEQRTDFSIEFPYNERKRNNGIVIEIDGGHHRDVTQQSLDRQRDVALASLNWGDTVRVTTTAIQNNTYQNAMRGIIALALDNPFVVITRFNYVSSLIDNGVNQHLLELTIVPFAIARIQRTIVELVLAGSLDTNTEVWKIAIVERDVPCGALALKDLQLLVACFSTLSREVKQLPVIEVSVFVTPEFENSDLQFAQSVLPLSEFQKDVSYDVVFDVSILTRGNLLPHVDSSSMVAVIRSSHYSVQDSEIYTDRHVEYMPICAKKEDETWIVNEDRARALNYLFSSIFRKKKFRDGQLPILSKALQARTVIGLLPTGGGKSVTYQLSALLQPGICLIIDPIRSLMKDQVDGLGKQKIDSSVFVNSTLKGEEKQQALRQIASGSKQFVFISPERMQTKEFRDLLDVMFEEKKYFSYCVIDEAHCVSEWGHDFRTAYLKLGDNAYKYCRSKNPPVPLFGLTATASFDVLTDIQRELSGYGNYSLDDDSLVRFESTKRPEIQFLVEEIVLPTEGYTDSFELKRVLGEAKKKRITQILDRLLEHFLEFHNSPEQLFEEKDFEGDKKEKTEVSLNKMLLALRPDFFNDPAQAGLIFCPHKSGPYGITDQFKIRQGENRPLEGVLDELKSRPNVKAGFFMGSGDSEESQSDTITELSMENQELFMSDKLNLMVATKAFGMGIDKPHVRYTIHMNYPSSIESFVQETGRAGRDGKMAFAYLLFNSQKFKVDNRVDLIDHDKDVNLFFHNNSFKGEEKELDILNELLTQIHLPDRTAQIENLILDRTGIQTSCSYRSQDVRHRLYIDLAYQQSLGYVDLVTLTGSQHGTVNTEYSTQVIPLVVEYLRSLQLAIPAYEWIQLSDQQEGIEYLLERLSNGEQFEVEVGFINNQKDRIKTLARWLTDVVAPEFTETIVKEMRQACNDGQAFVERVVEKYYKLTGQVLNLEEICLSRDHNRGEANGTTLKKFKQYFNGYRNKADTERAIYRLSLLGVIDDYTVNFSAETFTLYGTKKTQRQYNDRLKSYLLKFFGKKSVDQLLTRINEQKDETYIRKCLRFLVNFVYSTIKEKRKLAINEMCNACDQAIEKREGANMFLREYIDLYFNSKYARQNHKFNDPQGREIKASLLEETDGVEFDVKTIWRFIEIVDIDSTGTPVENLKHLKGATVRLITTSPYNPVFRMLNAFTLFMLDYQNQTLMQEAFEHLMVSFEKLETMHNSDNDALRKIFNKYKRLIYSKNEKLEESLSRFDLVFEFEYITMSKVAKQLEAVNRILNKLNQKLDS